MRKLTMNAVQRSILFSALERYASLLLFFVSIGILSRLLTPKEFGIYAVVLAITSVFSASSQEFGGANYLIQKFSLSEANVRAAFTITFGLSVAVGALLYLLSGLAESALGADGLSDGLAVAAINFVIMPFSVTIIALYRRAMQFGVIAASTLACNFTTICVSIALATMGYSYLAPIWGMIAGASIQAVYLIAARRDLRIFRPSLQGYLEVVRFGLYSSGVVLINVFYSSAPQLFLARTLDFTTVGLYSRACTLTQVFDRLVIQTISPVIMPAILAQTNAGADLKRLYLHAISLLTVLHWPFLIFMAVMAKPIIVVWLGPSWLDVVPLVRLLCIAQLSLFAACLTYPVLVAAGSVRDTLLSSLISLPPSLLIIFVASFFSVEAVAGSALLTLTFQAAVAFSFVGRHLDLRFIDFVHATNKSGVVALCCCMTAVICALVFELGLIGPMAAIFMACGTVAATWLAAIFAVQHPLLPELKPPTLRLVPAALQSAGRVPLPIPQRDRDGS